MRRKWLIRRAPIIALIAAAAVALFGFVVMNLWNWLAPELFGLHTITFWQAFGLLILTRILFGGFGGRSRGMHWRGRMMERWDKMSPEEREKFLQGTRPRCGFEAAGGEPQTAKE